MMQIGFHRNAFVAAALCLSVLGPFSARADSVFGVGLGLSREYSLGSRDITYTRVGPILYGRAGLHAGTLELSVTNARFDRFKAPGVQGAILYGPGMRTGDFELALQTGLGASIMVYPSSHFPIPILYVEVPVRATVLWNPTSMLGLGFALTGFHGYDMILHRWFQPRAGGQLMLVIGAFDQ